MARRAPPLELITAAQQGEQGAIVSLLAASQPDIRRYARANCKVNDVDDAVQDTLWLLYRRIGALRVVGAFSGWLFEIVRRECRRLARRAFGQSAPLDAVADDLAFASRPADELRLDLAAAIHSLPPHYRQVLLLRDIEELTIGEIATTTGLTREAVKARLHRARAMVREYIED